MEAKLYNIVAIVNEGFADYVMYVARDCGARGGTIIAANGSVTTDEAQKLYGLGVHPEKEIVLILVHEDLVNKILESLYDKLGTNTEAMGIFFSLPVTHASDNLLSQYNGEKKPEPKKETEEPAKEEKK